MAENGVRIPIVDRFWSHVDKNGSLWNGTPCWIWTAGQQRGYGRFALGGRHGKTVKAHRFAYELLVGMIPEDLGLDHLCRNRICVNPNHLEAVTTAVNIVRGQTGSNHAAKTHCPYGHQYDLFNTRYEGGSRRCKECDRIKHRRKQLIGAAQ